MTCSGCSAEIVQVEWNGQLEWIHWPDDGTSSIYDGHDATPAAEEPAQGS